MSNSKIVVLTRHSLYTAGVVKRLEQSAEHLELVTVDIEAEDAIEEIESQQPNAVIVDSGFDAELDCCSLDQILERFPSITVIWLDPGKDGFQVVTSEQRSATEVNELISALEGLND